MYVEMGGESFLQIRWSHANATNPPFGGFVNYPAPNSIINAPMAIDSSNTAIVFNSELLDCYIPPPPNAITVGSLIAELAEYGIIAYASGLPTSQPQNCIQWNLNNGQTWTLEELQQILKGVQKTAKSFYMLRHNLYGSSYNIDDLTGTSPEEKQLFYTIMDTPEFQKVCKIDDVWMDIDVDGFYLLRVTNAFKFGNDPQGCDYEDLSRGIVTADEACTSNGNAAIAFYGSFYSSLQNIEFTMVHELGHRFDNQSAIGLTTDTIDQKLSNRIGLRIGVILDANGNIVMGVTSNAPLDWLRGARGWGDAVPPNSTGRFQQNSMNVIYDSEKNTDQTTEISEATADMFLNWVYRRTTDEVSNRDNTFSNPPIRSTWEDLNNADSEVWLGFRNINGNGQYDTSLPGNARYWWIDNKMCVIFERMLKRLGYLGINETLECKP